jgi:phosphoglycolate phosphatase
MQTHHRIHTMSDPEPTRPFDLILFDLDGTLVETAPELCDALNDTLIEAGLPEVALEQVRRWIGHGTHDLLVRALASASQGSADSARVPELSELLARFDHHYPLRCGTSSHLYPHVREVLLALRAQGVMLAVVTNKDERFTRVVLDAHHMAALFDRVVSGDSFPRKKPDPMGVLACLAQFQVRPERALFVGDSAIDVATARAAGLTVWALPYGYNQGLPIEDAAPDRIVSDFSALLTLDGPAQPVLPTVPGE